MHMTHPGFPVNSFRSTSVEDYCQLRSDAVQVGRTLPLSSAIRALLLARKWRRHVPAAHQQTSTRLQWVTSQETEHFAVQWYLWLLLNDRSFRGVNTQRASCLSSSDTNLTYIKSANHLKGFRGRGVTTIRVQYRGHIAPNGNMTNELWICKYLEGSGYGHIETWSRKLPIETEERYESLSQNSRWFSQDSNRVPRSYKPRALHSDLPVRSLVGHATCRYSTICFLLNCASFEIFF
jgi:hypothetical protein